MTPDFKIRKGDTGRAIIVVIRDNLAAFVSLPSGSTAVFRMTGPNGNVVTGSATIGNYQGGTRNQLTYPFQAGDTDVVGVYDAVFVVTGSGGYRETFPTTSEHGSGLTVEVCA